MKIPKISVWIPKQTAQKIDIIFCALNGLIMTQELLRAASAYSTILQVTLISNSILLVSLYISLILIMLCFYTKAAILICIIKLAEKLIIHNINNQLIKFVFMQINYLCCAIIIFATFQLNLNGKTDYGFVKRDDD